jgi:hypothetical protein
MAAYENVYIMFDAKNARGENVKIVKPARDYQKESYNDFITNVPKYQTKKYTFPQGITFDLEYDEDSDYDDKKIVYMIRTNGSPSMMSFDEDFLNKKAGFINRVSMGLGGKKKSNKRKSNKRKSNKRKFKKRKSNKRKIN